MPGRLGRAFLGFLAALLAPTNVMHLIILVTMTGQELCDRRDPVMLITSTVAVAALPFPETEQQDCQGQQHSCRDQARERSGARGRMRGRCLGDGRLLKRGRVEGSASPSDRRDQSPRTNADIE